jgi:putative membrane protein
VIGSSNAVPYCGPASTPADWLSHWNTDPVLITALVACAAGWLRYAPRSPDRDLAAGTAFAVAILLFVSPLCALTSALFSVRVVHHILLAAVVAPLLAFAVRDRLSVPLWPATALHFALFWLWHWPPAYATALSSDLIFWLMQLTILGSGVAFWTAILRAPPIAAVAALLATMVQMGALGALITFAGDALYAPHWSTTGAWGLAPLEDQQIAGLVMWAPAAAIYLLAALAILYRSLQAEPAR